MTLGEVLFFMQDKHISFYQWKFFTVSEINVIVSQSKKCILKFLFLSKPQNSVYHTIL